MDAKQFRVGNLLHQMDEYVTQVTDIITGSDLETVYIKCYAYDQDEVSPIPLTEEWLLKLGFKLNSYDNYELEYTYKLNERFTILNRKTGYFYIDAPNQEIEYVHQLQNLHFALTQEELTFKQ